MYYVIAYKTLSTKIRNHILLRDKNQCACKELCKGETKNLHIHHKDGNRENNSDDNLITVCRLCHSFLERPLRIKRGYFRKKFPKMEMECNFCAKKYPLKSHRGFQYCSKICYKDHRLTLSKTRLKFPRNSKLENEKKRNRYAQSKEFREKIKGYCKRYFIKMKNDPIKAKEYRIKNTEAVRRHREKKHGKK